MKAFKFKQFQLYQDQCAMKIGTDGCLLGAWAKPTSGKKILDIGTGTGLIACMLAQRFPSAQIDAIELDIAAANQAYSNVAGSPFAHQIHVSNADFRSWEIADYDYLVCNPPFFEESSSSSQVISRKQARQEATLSISELFKYAFLRSNPKAELGIVWPARRADDAKQAAAEMGWFLVRKCALYPTPEKEVHRVLFEFSKTDQPKIEEKLVIEQFGRHQYSDDYRQLLKDFYLKF